MGTLVSLGKQVVGKCFRENFPHGGCGFMTPYFSELSQLFEQISEIDNELCIKVRHTLSPSSSISSSRLIACLNANLIVVRFNDDIGNLEPTITVS